MARMRSIAEDVIAEALADKAKFILVEMDKDGPAPVYDHYGQLLKFTDGAKAAAAAEDYTARRGKKVQPRPVNNTDWRAREQGRLDDASYTALPWGREKWWVELSAKHKDHFPHVSIGKSTLVAFTETEEKGSADVQTAIKCGKYLERFFGEVLNNHVIRDLCTVFSAKFEDNRVLWAETADEIEEVYKEGPSSCMSKGMAEYKGCTEHPVRAYASGDLKIAYLQRDGRVVARALVYPEKKLYSRFYGDGGRLEPLLKKEGYKGGPPVGARIVPIRKEFTGEHKGKFAYIAPHIDDITHLIPKGDELIIGSGKSAAEIKGNSIQLTGPSGLTEMLGFKCIKCDRDDLPQRSILSTFVNEKQTNGWCRACVEQHAFTCPLTGHVVSDDQGVEVKQLKSHGKPFMAWRARTTNSIARCDATGDYYQLASLVAVKGGARWNADYFRENGTRCTCGANWPTKAGCGEECEIKKNLAKTATGLKSKLEAVSSGNAHYVTYTAANAAPPMWNPIYNRWE